MVALEHTHFYHAKAVTWILVADSKEAKIFNYVRAAKQVPLSGTSKMHYFQKQETHRLVEMDDGSLKAESLDDYHFEHQQRGTANNSYAAERNTYEPHGNTKNEIKRRYVKHVAEWLERASLKKAFDQLIIAAPAKIIGELREQLPADVQHRIAAVLPKDLMVYQEKDLLDHLQDTLSEAHAV